MVLWLCMGAAARTLSASAKCFFEFLEKGSAADMQNLITLI